MKLLFVVFFLLWCNTTLIGQVASTLQEAKDLFEMSWRTENEEERRQQRQKIREISPESIYGLYCKAWFLRVEKKYNEALILSNTIIAKFPNNWEGYYSRGVCYELLKNNQQATINYNLAIKLSANDYFMRGSIKFNTKDYKGSIEDFDKVLASNFNDYDVIRLKAQSYHNLSDYEKAFENYQILLGNNKIYEGFYSNYANVNKNLNRYETAVEYLDKAIAQNPNSAYDYFERGWIKSERLKEYQAAIADYLKVIELDNKIDVAYFNIGISYSNLGNISEAKEWIRKAGQIDKKHLEKFASIYRMKAMGSFGSEKSIEFLSIAIEFDEEPVYYHSRGTSYSLLDDKTNAMKDFNSAISLLTLKPDISLLGKVYYDRGFIKNQLKDFRGSMSDYDKAITSFYKILNTDKESKMLLCKSLNNRAICKYELKDYLGSINDCNAALKIDNNYETAYCIRGIARIAMGYKDLGCQDLSKAGELGYTPAYDLIQKNCK
ncbi:MAG: hypothetical protein EAZ85_10230 [Bacteroidetes bacterium]|nr:MAG: hypothetical protein EAZ85_10230 [Bacteroidota bacterium]TAG87141.1 MAG: hypothetical protein EAZ20_11280 [Bacteroidota bacterium]